MTHLNDQVEAMRAELLECVNEKGFMHQDSIRLSKELDELIVCQQKLSDDKE